MLVISYLPCFECGSWVVKQTLGCLIVYRLDDPPEAATMSNDSFGDRLLVIDAEPAFGQIVKKVAEASGFEVAVTQDASAFMHAARQWHPTVIMLDLKMPGIDGIQLLRTLAADNCPAHVVLTSGSDAKVLQAAMQLGRERGLSMSEALPKPVRVESLQERLAGLRGVARPLLAADLAA